MPLDELRARANEVRAAFESIAQSAVLIGRRNAKQWRFLRLCFERTLGATVDEWSPRNRQQIVQLKFEVEDKLRGFYLRHGSPVNFVFALVHRREARRRRLDIAADYPQTSGYHLLVRDRRDLGGDAPMSTPEVRAYLESVVTAGIDAEFAAYQRLPEIDDAQLLRVFRAEGPAYRDLKHTLTQLSRRGWVISNPLNPSSKRLLAIAVKEMGGGRAVIRTTEYWYLRWWSTPEGKYRYPYRETNHQTYVVVYTGGRWQVDENIRPAPRTSTPHRQRK